MEENPSNQMETDVSSTTQDIPLVQETSGPTSTMEVTVEVAETTAEAEEAQEEHQDQRIDSNTLETKESIAPEQSTVHDEAQPTTIEEKPIIESPVKSPIKSSLKTPNKSPNKIIIQEASKILPFKITRVSGETLNIKEKNIPKVVIIKNFCRKNKPESIVKKVATNETPVESKSSVAEDESSPAKLQAPTAEVSSIIAEPKISTVEPSKPTPEVQTSPAAQTPEVEQSTSSVADSGNKPESVEVISKNEVALIPDNPASSKEDDIESQAEVSTSASETSEKEHNRSISRELKSLMNSAKESKIISECTQLKSKTRKSRTLLDSSNTSLNSSADADKIQGNRRESTNSHKSNCSEKSEKALQKRSMRSQNPEFVIKHKQFLNTVTAKFMKERIEEKTVMSDVETEDKKAAQGDTASSPKKKKIDLKDLNEMNKLRSDPYCWRCHYLIEETQNEKTQTPIQCTVCPRSFHYKCLSVTERQKIVKKNWVCPKCMSILEAESSETRSSMMKKCTLGMLCELFKYALNRMMEVNGVEPFLHPVDRTAFPDYDKYVVHAVDLTLMKENITAGRLYGSTEAFMSDAEWILHNSIIFNTLQSKLTTAARALVRCCRAECGDIDACPQCYASAHAHRPTWFTDVCDTPHVLLWAKLKGFPYWPAKGMAVNSVGMVDVRFFGAHDRAWVHSRDCYLYSEKDPNYFKNKRQDIIDSMQEAEQHIRNISRKFGKFVYPEFKVPFEPSKIKEQMKQMIPGYEPEGAPCKVVDSPSPASARGRPSSKLSKDSFMECDKSGPEDDPLDTTKEEDVDKKNGNKNKEVTDSSKTAEKPNKGKENEEKENMRKRRRSALEEAVITVINSPPAKKKRLVSAEMVILDNNKDTPKTDEINKEKTDKASEPAKKVEEDKKETDKSQTPKVIKLATPASTSKPRPANKLTPKTPKEAEKTKKKPAKRDKSTSSEKEKAEDKPKPKGDRTPKTTPQTKETTKVIVMAKGNGADLNKSSNTTPKNKPKSTIRDHIIFDKDNNSLANIAKKDGETVFPTITNVRSLSQTDDPASANKKAKESVSAKEVPAKDVSAKEASAKLQKLRSEPEVPVVGRVGVRAFARMTEPPAKEQVEVEVKAEPMDYEETERQNKIDLMNTIQLRPVNPQAITGLRDVRICKVTTSVTASPTLTVTSVMGGPARRSIVVRATSDVRPRARKTFPQPQKGAEHRSELNGKNSMVYIPIQPPAQRPPAPLRPLPPAALCATTNTVNSVPSPLVQPLASALPVPSAVHSVPLITSVNGQWTFSLQPMMSVGGTSSPPPLVNGIADPVPILSSPPPLPPPAVNLGEPPRLQQKPPPPAIAPLPVAPPPPSAGPLTAQISQNANKLADMFRTLLEESIEKLDYPAGQCAALKVQLEKLQWKSKQEIEELKHNHELMLAEMRLSFEKEKQRLAADTRRACQLELGAAISHAKARQWCANCQREAQFYCCWNTSYCDHQCQRTHWKKHYTQCTQQRSENNGDPSDGDSVDLTGDRLHTLESPPILKKTPALRAAANKTPTRLVGASSSPNTSLIVIDDKGGSAGSSQLRCVGTYKPNQALQNSVLLNKQLMTNEESSSKKLVTSGGYLIVGANVPDNNPPLVNY